MKIRSLKHALLALGVVVSFSACRDNVAEPIELAEGQQLSFLPSIKDMNEESIRTRATENSFFADDDKISVKITTSRETDEKTYSYTYKGGAFTGDFKFSSDNTYISKLVALWPAENSEGRSKIITDQREYENYKQANRLKATGSTDNIMPTAAPVPLIFEHEQSRITFRLAGQNANGLIIKSLLLELENVDLGDETKQKAGFWAYCEEAGTLNAKIILPAGVQFGPKGENDGRLKIGLITVGAEGTKDKDYRGIMYIPNRIGIELKANHDYLVTLTPEGYDLMATIAISGFPQPDGDHLGIPFQLPVENTEAGRYDISTVAQLVTISWLLDGDLNDEKKSDWNSETRTFDIVRPIVLSDKIRAEKDRYLKASVLQNNKEKFSNRGNVTYSDGTPVFGE